MAFPETPPRTVAIVAVPEHVAVPFPAVAVVGAAVALWPRAVITRAVPPAMVLVPVSATVAVAVLELLKVASAQVWPTVPVVVIPLV